MFYWPLVKVLKTFPGDNQNACTAIVLMPDLSEEVVNVNHLTSLELYVELDNLHVSASVSAAASFSHRNEQASRAEARALASEELVKIKLYYTLQFFQNSHNILRSTGLGMLNAGCIAYTFSPL